jgi:hypothetical protein
MIIQGLTKDEQLLHGGANFRLIVTHRDLTETTVATVQVINAFNVSARDMIDVIDVELIEPFEDTSDVSFIGTYILVGDSASITRYISSVDVNKNSTDGGPYYKSKGTGVRYCYTTDNVVLVRFSPQYEEEEKALADLDRGEVHIYLRKL